MERTPQECFEKLMNAYSHNYDLTRDVEAEGDGSASKSICIFREFFKNFNAIIYKLKKNSKSPI